MSDEPAPRVWRGMGPEDRLSIATDRFLRRALVTPFWVGAMPDSDHGTRSDLQRIRDANKGQRPGVLDWLIVQGPPPLIRCLELKRGRNKLTEHQERTVEAMTLCGAAPIIAWSLADVHAGLVLSGFRFEANAFTTLAHMEMHLAAWDREAANIREGVTIRKPSKPRGPRVRPGLSWIRP